MSTFVLDRAPDEQSTESIRQIVANERVALDFWEQSKDLNARSLTTAINMAVATRKSVAKWEGMLAVRLAEEAAPVEVTGL